MESASEFEAHLQLRGAVTGASGANRSDAATADAANATASRSPSDSSVGAIRHRKPNARHASWAHGDGCREEYSASLQPRHVYGPGQEAWIWGSLQPSLLAMELQEWHQQGLGFVNFIRPDDAQRFQKDMGGSTLTKNTRRAACPFGLNVQMSRASSPTEPASPKNPTLVHGCCPQSQWCHCWRLENGVEFPDAARKAKLSPWWKPRLSAGPYAAAEDPPSAFVVWLMSLSAASEAPDIVLKHIRVCAGWQIWQEMSWYHHVTRRCEPDWPVSLSAHRRGESLNADYAVPMEHFLSNPPPAIAEKKG